MRGPSPNEEYVLPVNGIACVADDPAQSQPVQRQWSNRNVAVPFRRVAERAWRSQGIIAGERVLAEEVAIAFVYDGGSYAVMMATPQNLEDFALGFSLSEGIVAAADHIRDLEIVEQQIGIELRMWLSGPQTAALSERRRYVTGPTGCGLCGIDSLTEAMRPVPQVGDARTVRPLDIMQAIDALMAGQELNRQTHAVHAAGFWQTGAGLLAVREDVGRHNALDKLGGALAREHISGCDGILLLTSRLTVEMVQKAAVFGVPIVVAVSAPTALAVRAAEKAGMTLIAIARSDGFEIFSHPQRIVTEAAAGIV